MMKPFEILRRIFLIPKTFINAKPEGSRNPCLSFKEINNIMSIWVLLRIEHRLYEQLDIINYYSLFSVVNWIFLLVLKVGIIFTWLVSMNN